MGKKVVVFAGHYDDLYDLTGSKGIKTKLEKDGVYEEFDSNIVIARETVKFLRKVKGIDVYFPQEHGADYRSLKSRVDYCNNIGADFAMFIHSNAGPSTAKGACSFYHYKNHETKKLSQYYGQLIKEAGYPLWSGGEYGSNPNDGWSYFYVLRYTKMDAILTENFFFTNPYELKEFLQDPTDLKQLGLIHAKVACKKFNLTLPDDVKGKVEVLDPINKGWLEEGDYGASVGELQKKLNKIGYNLKVDNSFGPKTAAAVGHFQENHDNLKKDYSYGPKTQKALEEALKRYQAVSKKDSEEEKNIAATGFADVPAGEYYSDAVKWAKKEGLVFGSDSENNILGLGRPVKIEDLCVVLYREKGEPKV